ncbi:Tryptophan synthase alpha chain [Neobacillus rhizosphaerae]|uniref:Tryptophan synthase alpha chain n=1 Tax=Neobacillus rhizosphaerae TaxID=2880965 RepID=A0ABN8KQE3_9BACI|nr:tryptophan synthase subunit alpha [Neobacillus rhizosphaerae]CAH2714328.1 Tryptophan synthase alpha chain [Neobacillus rhizosphaerae]
MNRLEQSFELLNENDGKAFVPYLMAGDGGLECLVDRLLLLEKFGATAIEVGVPFSDPVADGPIIQNAGIRALKSRTTLKGIITELAKARELVTIPIILMTYLNPIYAYGIGAFVQDIQNAGVDGCIIPDLPIEEEDMLVPQLAEAQIELIRLVTPATPLERIKQIAGRGKGFLYMVTVKGITGTRNLFQHDLNQFLRAVKELSPIPVLAGFGISSQEQINELTKYCDGVVVGSRIVELFEKNNLSEMEILMSIFNKNHK